MGASSALSDSRSVIDAAIAGTRDSATASSVMELACNRPFTTSRQRRARRWLGTPPQKLARRRREPRVLPVFHRLARSRWLALLSIETVEGSPHRDTFVNRFI